MKAHITDQTAFSIVMDEANVTSVYYSSRFVTVSILVVESFLGVFVLLMLAVFRPTSSIKSKCATLVGALALCDGLISAQYVQYGMTLLANCKFTTLDCFYSQIPYWSAGFGGYAMFSLIGIDRLLAISKPLMYRNINERKYIRTIFVTVIVYAIVVPSTLYIELLVDNNDADIVPTCTLFYSGGGGFFKGLWSCVAVVNLIAILIVYLLALRQLKRGEEDVIFASRAQAEREKKFAC